MIKTSEEKYVTIKRFDLYGEKAIPCGQVRENNGVTEALFFLISGNNLERKVWLQRNDLSTSESQR
jgi:hypothetical protein